MADTEAEAVEALAAQPVVSVADRGKHYLSLPPAWTTQTIDTEPSQPAPYRSRGIIAVQDAASFVRACAQRSEMAVVYADPSKAALVAVLNDDQGAQPGWRDYRVALSLVPTPEWTHWRQSDAAWMAQSEFAEHIQDGLTEISVPSAADMLEIAQTFQAHTSAEFKSGNRLANGQVQLVYTEDIAGTAGGAGQLQIPERIELELSPFYGSAPIVVAAWFRYRLVRDKLTLSYKLDRPHEVERAAFDTVVDQVRAAMTEATFINGSI